MNILSKLFFVVFALLASIYLQGEDREVMLSDIKISAETEGGNSCILYVKTSSGSPAKSVKVSTDVSGGISCAGGRSFYTDSDGKVTLEWVSGCYLKKIYIKGKGHNVNYQDGETYYIKMN